MIRRLIAGLAAMSVTIGLLGGAATAVIVDRANLRPAYAVDGLLVVLAIGSDVGPPQRPGDPLRGRADAIHLLAVDTTTLRATIVDFPRDSLVGGRKINAFLATGGPDSLVGAVEGLTGIDIDFYALTSFRGLENLVDGLDGLDVVVDQPMRDRFSGSDFQPGPQQFRGVAALAYARDRKSVAGGDFGRARHQGDMLRFAQAQISGRQADLASLTRLTALFARNTVSNISTTDLLPMALLAAKINPADVWQVPLGGNVGMFNGASVVRLAPGDTFVRIAAGQVGPPPP